MSRARRILWSETPTVALRQLVSSDLDAVHALVSRMDVVRHMRFALCSRADAARFLSDSIAETPAAPWRSVVRAILSDGDFAGMAGLSIIRGCEEGELWYLLHPDWWGRGIATDAARQLLAFGFGALRLHRVWATCLPENPASARVLEKLGMRREGLLVRNAKIQGEWKDCWLYAMVEDEWRDQPSTPALRALARMSADGPPEW